MTPTQELAIIRYATDLIGQPFAYGQNDCPLMAAGALDCMDGGNRREQMRGLWHDQKSAWKYERLNGTIADHLRREGCKDITATFATIGDFILMERTLAHDRKWHSVALCLGQKSLIMTEESGAMLVETHALPPSTEVLR